MRGLKPGDLCMLRGKPCEIVEYTEAGHYYHGPAETTVSCFDIFTGEEFQEIIKPNDVLICPDVQTLGHYSDSWEELKKKSI